MCHSVQISPQIYHWLQKNSFFFPFIQDLVFLTSNEKQICTNFCCAGLRNKSFCELTPGLFILLNHFVIIWIHTFQVYLIPQWQESRKNRVKLPEGLITGAFETVTPVWMTVLTRHRWSQPRQGCIRSTPRAVLRWCWRWTLRPGCRTRRFPSARHPGARPPRNLHRETRDELSKAKSGFSHFSLQTFSLFSPRLTGWDKKSIVLILFSNVALGLFSSTSVKMAQKEEMFSCFFWIRICLEGLEQYCLVPLEYLLLWILVKLFCYVSE